MAEPSEPNGNGHLFKVNPDTDSMVEGVLEEKTGEGVLFGGINSVVDDEASSILNEKHASLNEIVVVKESVGGESVDSQGSENKNQPEKKYWVIRDGKRIQVLWNDVDSSSDVLDGEVKDSDVPEKAEQEIRLSKEDFLRLSKDALITSKETKILEGDSQQIKSEKNRKKTVKSDAMENLRKKGVDVDYMTGRIGIEGTGEEKRHKGINRRKEVIAAIEGVRFGSVTPKQRETLNGMKIGDLLEGWGVDQNLLRNENDQHQPAEPFLGETEESKKARLVSEAHDFLSNLIATRSSVDSVDEIAFRNWVTNHGKYADSVDLTRANALLGELATRRENRERQKEVEKRQREDDRNRMIDEERKSKEERAENERLERKRQSDARQAIIDNEKAEKQRQIDAKKIEFEREKLAREIRQAAEDEKRRLQQESYKEWLDLRDELKLSLPSTKGRKEWLLKMKDFISRNEPIDGHQGTVTQAKEKLKEAEEKELTFSGKALRFLMNSTILLIPNIINSLTGGWWYKTTAGKPLKK